MGLRDPRGRIPSPSRTRRDRRGMAILALVTERPGGLLPWWMLAGGLVGIVAVALIFRDPFVGVMLTLALAAQAVPGVLLPAIPVGGVPDSTRGDPVSRHPGLVPWNVHTVPLARISARRELGSAGRDACLPGRARRLDRHQRALTTGGSATAYPLLRNFLPLTLLPFLPADLRQTGTDRAGRAVDAILFGVLIAASIATQAFAGVQLLAGRLEKTWVSCRQPG